MVTIDICDSYPIWDTKLVAINRDEDGKACEWYCRKGLIMVRLERVHRANEDVWRAFFGIGGETVDCGRFKLPYPAIEKIEIDVSLAIRNTLDIAGVMPLLREFEKHLHPMVAIRRHPAEIPEWRQAWLAQATEALFGPEGMPRPATSETMMEVTGTLLGYNFVPHNDEGTLAHIFVQMMVDSKTFNAKCYDGKRVRLILELLE